MKRIKMILYGEPGVGKSVFAVKFPKPFFICSDNNYEWLLDFGAKEEAHIKVTSWAQAKKVFKEEYNDYETIVVDLTEDLFMWCELEWCNRNGVEHPSDLGWGKGYSGPRNEFFVEISRLLAKDKHIVLLMHGEVITLKNKRGVEYNTYRPTSRIPDKLLDQLEGRVRYCLRAYIDSKEVDGKLVKTRYLSLVPKEDEYGIIRGVNENEIPQTIPLDFNVFWNTVIGSEKPIELSKEVKEEIKKEAEEVEEVKEKPTRIRRKKVNNEVGDDGLTDEQRNEFKEQMEKTNSEIEKIREELKSETIGEKEINGEDVIQETVVQEEKPLSKEEKLAALKAKLNKVNQEVKEEPKQEIKEEVKAEVKEVIQENKPLTREEKLAALKAKLQNMKR
jgi:hypothetical protein